VCGIERGDVAREEWSRRCRKCGQGAKPPVDRHRDKGKREERKIDFAWPSNERESP